MKTRENIMSEILSIYRDIEKETRKAEILAYNNF